MAGERNAGNLPRECANCGAVLSGAYCSACGQKDGDNHPSLLHLVEDYVDTITHADSRIWRTLGLMTGRPGAVTKGYLDGKRASFIPPVRFYFIVSVIFFLALAAANVALVQFQPVVVPVKPGGLLFLDQQRGDDRALVVEALTFVPIDDARPAGLSPEVIAEVKKNTSAGTQSFIFGLQEVVADPVGSNELIATWVPRLLVAVMPLFALWLWLITRRKAPIYDHMVFSLYFHAFLFMVLTLLLVLASLTSHQVPGRVWTAVLGIAAAVHLFAALRRVHGLTWLRTAVTFVFAVIGYGLSFALCVAAILVPQLLRT